MIIYISIGELTTGGKNDMSIDTDKLKDNFCSLNIP